MLQDKTECDLICSEFSNDLVARGRPQLRIPPYRQQPLAFIDGVRPRQVILASRIGGIMAQYSDANPIRLPRNLYYVYCYYLVFIDYDKSFWLVAGFDTEVRMHKAFWCLGYNRPMVQVSRKEFEIREYFLDIRCILKDLEEPLVIEFLWNATHVNTVKWDEALELVSGKLSLQEVAFQRMHQVPSGYLKRYSRPEIYNRILFTPSP